MIDTEFTNIELENKTLNEIAKDYDGIVLFLIPNCKSMSGIVELQSLGEKYELFSVKNWKPIVLTSNKDEDIEEIKKTYDIQFDILSDQRFKIGKALNMIGSRGQLLRRTIICDSKLSFRKAFHEILPLFHVDEVLQWISYNRDDLNRNNLNSKIDLEG